MAREVRLRPRLVADIVRITRSIEQSVSITAARRWRNQLEAVIRSLGQDSDLWPEADEAALLNRNLRCRLFGKRRHVYRILFTIQNEVVTVHRIRHAAQDFITEDEI